MESDGRSPNQQCSRNTTRALESGSGEGGAAPEAPRRNPEQYMPLANITRIMRGALPPHAKIADDAKESIQLCVSEFIGFVTSEANKPCRHERRKIITPEDVLGAMASLGFHDYVGPLTAYLTKYRAESGSADRLPMVRRGGSLSEQPPAAQMARTQSPPAPTAAAEADDDQSEYIGLSEVISEYFLGNRGGGGEGSSGGAEL